MTSIAFLRGIDIINSNTENYLGVYLGKTANEIGYYKLNNSDCIILMGGVLSDLNTSCFDYEFKYEDIIDIQPNYVTVKGRKFDNINIKDVISRLNEKITYKNNETIKRTFQYESIPEFKETDPLSTRFIYPRLNKFIKEDDILITEVGLVPFGSIKMVLKNNMDIENQMMWGSIGWATPCTLGCALAAKNRRTILITGDGSHQLTAQEVATMMRNKIKPIIFVINNSGYTVERILCDDPEYDYNNISSWNYSMLPRVFKGDCFSATIKTNKEFDEILAKIETIQKETMCYIELVTDYLDVPYLAKSISKHELN